MQVTSSIPAGVASLLRRSSMDFDTSIRNVYPGERPSLQELEGQNDIHPRMQV